MSATEVLVADAKSSVCVLRFKVEEKAYRSPRVFGDKFGDQFGDSPYFVINLVTMLVTHFVRHHICHNFW